MCRVRNSSMVEIHPCRPANMNWVLLHTLSPHNSIASFAFLDALGQANRMGAEYSPVHDGLSTCCVNQLYPYTCAAPKARATCRARAKENVHTNKRISWMARTEQIRTAPLQQVASRHLPGRPQII